MWTRNSFMLHQWNPVQSGHLLFSGTRGRVDSAWTSMQWCHERMRDYHKMPLISSGLIYLLWGFRRANVHGGVYIWEAYNLNGKRALKQAIAVLSIYWFLIIIKCKLQNVKIYQIHLEMDLYLGELIIGGGGGFGAYKWGTYACKQQFNVYNSFTCITHLNFCRQSFCKYCGYHWSNLWWRRKVLKDFNTFFGLF